MTGSNFLFLMKYHFRMMKAEFYYFIINITTFIEQNEFCSNSTKYCHDEESG